MIILCEHPPTLSLGRASDAAAELSAGEAPYRELGWEVLRADRGGRSTWHGPGQLVCYPILDLRDHGKDLRRFAHDLERVVIEALAAFGIAAAAGEDREHVGVWVEDRKIASLGIRVEQLGRAPRLRAQRRLRPRCVRALPRLRLHLSFTSIAQELVSDVTTEEARGPVLDALAAAFPAPALPPALLTRA